MLEDFFKRLGRKPLDSRLTKPVGKYMCELGHHRWSEIVVNFGTGMPSTGVRCFRCNKEMTWKEYYTTKDEYFENSP